MEGQNRAQKGNHVSTITVTCPQCGNSQTEPKSAALGRITCNQCGHLIQN